MLTETECFALKGGPIYPASTNLVGTYAGVLQGVFDPTNPASSNSIGIFSLGVPKTGNATGDFVMFSRGRVFTGTVQAFADPQKATLKGILSATYKFNLFTTTTDPTTGVKTVVTLALTATANGPIDARISTSQSSSLFNSGTTLVRGDASINISEGLVNGGLEPVVASTLQLVVSGVKQSNTAPSS